MAKIEVIQVEFCDGTKYVARTDKANCHEVIKKITLEKRMVFEALSEEKKEEAKKYSLRILGGLSKRTLKTIEEGLYDNMKRKG